MQQGCGADAVVLRVAAADPGRMTTVLFPADARHLVQAVAHSSCGYRAECLCGWTSSWVSQPSAAQAACRQHREISAGPQSWLDAVFGGLLDLQDDLADAVFWLAESWTPELPPPRLCLRVVPLRVRCSTSEELRRVAQLLDVAVTGGRAMRRFGRVRIEVFSRPGRVG
jgi:hypothetical protein